jgi:hypothetical protein
MKQGIIVTPDMRIIRTGGSINDNADALVQAREK